MRRQNQGNCFLGKQKPAPETSCAGFRLFFYFPSVAVGFFVQKFPVGPVLGVIELHLAGHHPEFPAESVGVGGRQFPGAHILVPRPEVEPGDFAPGPEEILGRRALQLEEGKFDVQEGLLPGCPPPDFGVEA